MKARGIPITGDQQWHELRRTHVGGSEAAALFGESPYLTYFELWHRKKGRLAEPDLSGDERIFWGRHLESSILGGIRERTGWNIDKSQSYYSQQPELGLGGTPDALIDGHERGDGILEIKTVDSWQFKLWDGVPPLGYELQCQTYLELTGRAWACLAVLVGNNSLRLFTYERRPVTVGLIKARVRAFWASIEAGEAPAPDFTVDAEAVLQLHRDATPGRVVDLSDSNRLPELLDAYQRETAARAASDRVCKALRAEILSLVGDAEIALCGGWRIKATPVAGARGTLVTPDMVGQTIGGREGYRGLWISKPKEQRAA